MADSYWLNEGGTLMVRNIVGMHSDSTGPAWPATAGQAKDGLASCSSSCCTAAAVRCLAACSWPE